MYTQIPGSFSRFIAQTRNAWRRSALLIAVVLLAGLATGLLLQAVGAQGDSPFELKKSDVVFSGSTNPAGTPANLPAPLDAPVLSPDGRPTNTIDAGDSYATPKGKELRRNNIATLL